jgi:hypothetical protein
MILPMKMRILTLLLVCFAIKGALAQNVPASLLLQSPDGKTVKLLWLLQSWQPDITGFDIKRKDGLRDWVKLNTAPIVPGISVKKKLSLVEPDKSEEGRIKEKLFGLLKAGTLHETGSNYLKMLSGDEALVKSLCKSVSLDYDLALISGFAYTDHSATQKTTYEYGLFIAGTNKLLATASWNYGEIPDLDVVNEITSKSTPGKKGIQITWNADIVKMRNGDVAGFNIYRQGMRLNEHPITATNSKDLSEMTWIDRSVSSATPTQYSISAESVFGIEGRIKSYTYNPADHPKEYKKAEVLSVVSQGFYFKEGISVKWTFPKEYERFIKGVYVEKDNMPQGYTKISKRLDPATREYIDNSATPVSSYVRFRVVAVYNDRTIVPGSDLLYHYFPLREPPAPQNVRIRGVLEDKKYVMHISWDYPMRGDSVTDQHKVYLISPVSGKLSIVAENLPAKVNSYKHIIQNGVAAPYRFCVTAISRTAVESAVSDTVTIWAPSMDLPTPAINKISVENLSASIQWQYPEITDLRGFRLFQNQQLIATENELKKNIREFVTSKLEQGGAYDFTLRAVSENGVISNFSIPASIAVPKAKK